MTRLAGPGNLSACHGPQELLPGGMLFHVLNRGVGRLRLLEKAGDYDAFERIVEETRDARPMRICAYCLMPNHIGTSCCGQSTTGIWRPSCSASRLRMCGVGRSTGERWASAMFTKVFFLMNSTG